MWAELYSKASFLSFFYSNYSKTPKMSSGANFFQRNLFEGLIFGGAYIRKGNKKKVMCYRTFFTLFCCIFEGNFQVLAAEAYVRRGDLTEGFYRY